MDRIDMIQLHWDMYKEIHGFRPRHFDYDAMTDSQVCDEVNSLQEQYQDYLVREQKAQEQAVHDFEMRLQTLMSMGAKDRDMAIRWLAESVDANDDMDYVEYRFNLPYQYFRRVYQPE